MRAVSLPHFLRSVIFSRAFVFALLVGVAWLALLAFGASSVAAAPIPISDPSGPFRWV